MVDWGLIVVQLKKNENEKQEEKHENSEDSRLHSILQYFTSAGLGGQRFKLAISRRGARARTFNLLAPPQVECDESGAFGEWLKRPWGKQWTKRRQVSINLHWWPRRSALQGGDFEAAGTGTDL